MRISLFVNVHKLQLIYSVCNPAIVRVWLNETDKSPSLQSSKCLFTRVLQNKKCKPSLYNTHKQVQILSYAFFRQLVFITLHRYNVKSATCFIIFCKPNNVSPPRVETECPVKHIVLQLVCR
jgi:hypothetical protein